MLPHDRAEALRPVTVGDRAEDGAADLHHLDTIRQRGVERVAREVAGQQIRRDVEGIRPTIEALQLHAPIDLLVVAPDLLTSDFARDALDAALADGVEVMEVSSAVFRSISDRDGPQGLGAIVRQQWLSLPDVRLAEGDRWVALASVADPGNLGTILRTCDGSDAEGVILLDTSTDPYDPAAMRASMGAVFSRRLVRTSFEAFAEWARGERATVVGASDRAPETYREADYGARTVLCLLYTSPSPRDRTRSRMPSSA